MIQKNKQNFYGAVQQQPINVKGHGMRMEREKENGMPSLMGIP